MTRLLQVIGILLLCLLLVWIGLQFTIWREQLLFEIPHVSQFGLAFSGNEELPINTINAAIKRGEEAMQNRYMASRNYNIAFCVSDWISFGATAVITLLAGYFGHAPDSLKGQTSHLIKGRSRKFAGLIGTLAAIASINTALSGRLQTASATARRDGETISTSISQFCRDVKNAGTQDEASQVLNAYNAKLLRLQ